MTCRRIRSHKSGINAIATKKAVEARIAPDLSSKNPCTTPTPVITTLRMSGSKKRGAVDHAPHPSKLRTYNSIATRLTSGSQQTNMRLFFVFSDVLIGKKTSICCITVHDNRRRREVSGTNRNSRFCFQFCTDVLSVRFDWMVRRFLARTIQLFATACLTGRFPIWFFCDFQIGTLLTSSGLLTLLHALIRRRPL